VQLGDLALGQRDDLHSGEHETLVDGGHILLIAGEPIHGLGQDHVEAPALSVMHELLDAGADEGSAGDRPVRIAVDHRPALALGVLAA